jgi:hypothetical protein
MFRPLTHAASAADGHAPAALAGPSVSALEARQLRLLAYAVGDHLPVELVEQVVALEAQRRVLLATAAA